MQYNRFVLMILKLLIRTSVLLKKKKELLRFVLKDGTFWITSCKESANARENTNENNEIVDNGLWLVASSIKSNGNKVSRLMFSLF